MYHLHAVIVKAVEGSRESGQLTLERCHYRQDKTCLARRPSATNQGWQICSAAAESHWVKKGGGGLRNECGGRRGTVMWLWWRVYRCVGSDNVKKKKNEWIMHDEWINERVVVSMRGRPPALVRGRYIPRIKGGINMRVCLWQQKWEGAQCVWQPIAVGGSHIVCFREKWKVVIAAMIKKKFRKSEAGDASFWRRLLAAPTDNLAPSSGLFTLPIKKWLSP